MDNPYRNPDGSLKDEAPRDRRHRLRLERFAIAALPAAATLCVHDASNRYSKDASGVASAAMEIARELAHKHLREVK